MTAQVEIELRWMGDTAVHHGSGRNVITATALKTQRMSISDKIFTEKKIDRESNTLMKFVISSKLVPTTWNKECQDNVSTACE